MSDRGGTLLIAGAGAVKDSWRPVFAALQEVGPPGTLWSPELANQFMATVVHVARFGCYGNPENPDRREQLLTPRNQLCERLTDKLAAFTSEPQEGFDRALDKLIPADSECLAVTTNWDRVLDSSLLNLRGVGLLHLHGGVGASRDQSDLYLPTETAFETYFDEGVRQSYFRALHMVTRFAQRASRLVLYGLSISPLDAELATWLGAIMDGGIGEVFIVDPNAERVEQRFRVTLTENGLRVPVSHIWPP